jgi:hypothetical protein
VIDRTAPTITSIASSPNPAAVALGVAGAVSLTVTATDVGSSVVGGDYWIDGTTTPPATTTPFSGNPVTINSNVFSTAGTHTVRVRAKDAAGNFSAASGATVQVLQAVNDAYATTIQNNAAGNSRNQSVTVNAASGVLSNDQPIGLANRSATPTNPAVTRTAGTGAATMTVSMSANGGFTYTFTVPSSVTGNANIRAAKAGTYQFSYREVFSGVQSQLATVTITVQ